MFHCLSQFLELQSVIMFLRLSKFWVFTFLFPGLVIIGKLEGLLEFSPFLNNNGKRYPKKLSLEHAHFRAIRALLLTEVFRKNFYISKAH